MTPIRVKLSRERGARIPASTLCCTRRGRSVNPYANPYRIEQHHTGYWRIHITEPTTEQLYIFLLAERGYFSLQDAQADAVRCFRQWLDTMTPEELAAHLAPLREWEHLACWCGLDSPCHVDVLIEKLQRNDG